MKFQEENEMTLYETWLASAYYRNGRTNERTWADYIPREQAIYEDIIGNKLTSLSGTVTELAERYNVPKAYIAGFVDGINETQPEKIELETLTDDTQINLVIDLEKLYKQMVEYKADHLYSLPQWEDVFTREQLLDNIWGYEYAGETRTVDVHIKRIREKIKDTDNWSIQTVWGIGYKFEVR